MDRTLNLILFFIRRNHNVCIYSFVYSQTRRMFALKGTVPTESMDSSGCRKTSSLPRAPTSRPPRVKICSTAVKTSATAID